MFSSTVLAVEPTGFGELSSDDFVDSSKCANCHAIMRSQWQTSMHAYAYTDPLYQKEVLLASEDTDGHTDEFCSRCHTPVGVVGGEVPPIDGSMASDIAIEGVNCDFCHTVLENSDIGDGAYVSSPGDVKWGPRSDASASFHDSDYNELYTSADYCGMCHNVNSPFANLTLDDTYTTWSESSYAEEGVVCQDCHMTPGITEFEAKPGRSASSSPKRDNIFIHEFVGANYFMLNELSDGIAGDAAVESLQQAATIDVSVPTDVLPGNEVSFDVSITNSGAGHKLPTGISELRQMWVEVSVTDAEGKQLYSSGMLDADGNIVDGTIYRTVFADADGEVTTKSWNARSLVSDNRILPTETAVESYSFVMPDNAVDPVLVEAKLLYRTAPQDIVNELFGAGTYEVPVIDMTSAYGSINGDADIPSESTPGFSAMLFVLSMIAVGYIVRIKK